MAARIFPLFVLSALIVLSACGGQKQAEPAGNDTQRQEELLRKQADNFRNLAENNTGAIEQALENEGAIIFENRENLLNQAATNDTAPADVNTAQPRE